MQTLAYYGRDARLTGVAFKQVVNSIPWKQIVKSFRDSSLGMSKYQVDPYAAWLRRTGRVLPFETLFITMLLLFRCLPGLAVAMLMLAYKLLRIIYKPKNKNTYAIATPTLLNSTVCLP